MALPVRIGYLYARFHLAPQYHSLIRENSEPKERLPEAEVWERERASKCRGKRELHTIEMETYENDNTEAGPWVRIINLMSVLRNYNICI